MDAVDRAVRSIQQAQTDQRSVDVQRRPELTVDQQPVALKSGHLVMHGQRVGDLTSLVKAAILQNQDEIVFAVSAWQVERVLLRVFNPDYACHPCPNVSAGLAVLMRMKPIGSGTLGNRERGLPDGGGVDGLMRSAIHSCGKMESMPMDGDLLGKFVGNIETSGFSCRQAQHGAEERCIHSDSVCQNAG